MRVFEQLCPQPPDWVLPWDRIHDAFDWIRRLDGVPQDPLHHPEGDVAAHALPADLPVPDAVAALIRSSRAGGCRLGS